MPEPYKRTQLRALQATLDERWPKLPREQAERWLPRYREGRSPYSRVRSHAISTQLDAIIALALQMGLRRSEIFRLSANDVHYENAGAVVRDRSGTYDNAREVPFTGDAWRAVRDWLVCRAYVAPEHDRPWLNLHAAPTARQPMTVHTFSRVLVTYLGPEWSFARLRATSAVSWARCGSLPLEHLREMLGIKQIEDVLIYAQLAVTGTLGRDMSRLNGPFLHIVQPGAGWSNQVHDVERFAAVMN
jgi:integrase